MENIPKEWILEHKNTEKALGFLKTNRQKLVKYLINHQINDLYDLHQRYVPNKQYQDLKRKYKSLKQTVNQNEPQHHDNHAVVGKATVKDHQQPGPAPSIINQLKHHQH